MEHTAPEHEGSSDRAALVGLTLLMLAVTFLAYSPAAVPVIDDWTYAWSVGHFLRTGSLRMLEWSQLYPIPQILWGALWSQLFLCRPAPIHPGPGGRRPPRLFL